MVDAIGALAGGGGAAPIRPMGLLPQLEAGADKFAAAIGRATDSASAAGQAASGSAAGGVSPAFEGLTRMLDRVDLQARSVSDYAVKAEQAGGTLTPGEIVNLTMRCQEFMFQCQLTSNIANRGSDGVQQLFRQQG